MIISLVHPSRGRPSQAEGAMQEWWRRRSGTHAIEHILSVDADDDVAAYEEVAARNGVRLIVSANRTMVEAVNAGARRATGDIIVEMSDDFGCPDGWDTALADIVAGRPRAAVLVHDGLDGRIMTLPVLTRAYFEELGYIYHPSYRSMYADDDLTAVARRDGVLIDARRLVFPHRHPGAIDAVSARQSGHRAMWYGWRVFRRRQLTDFGARKRTTAVRIAEWRIDAFYLARVWGSVLRGLWLRRIGARLAGPEGRMHQAAMRLLWRLVPPEGMRRR